MIYTDGKPTIVSRGVQRPEVHAEVEPTLAELEVEQEGLESGDATLQDESLHELNEAIANDMLIEGTAPITDEVSRKYEAQIRYWQERAYQAEKALRDLELAEDDEALDDIREPFVTY